MWKSLFLLVIGCFVALRARSVPDGSSEIAPKKQFWKNGYEYSTIPLNENSNHGRRVGCKCPSKERYTRRPRIRTVIRRNDVALEDPEEIMESMLERYLLRVLLKKGLLSPPASNRQGNIARSFSRTQKQIQQTLPAFQHERAVYSDEENYRMTHNSRFYSQEPIPGQLLYPPISPKFHPTARVYPSGPAANLSKPRYVSSMLIPHFLNNTIAKPNEIVRNILRMNTTEKVNSTILPKRVRYGKNAGYINIENMFENFNSSNITEG
ncbi:uncharacterized protein LOC131679969 [Topomyia yanbarensis]|uniref:uncharacterized protein LOC131679969 n=1 Tax=Topomyia yanbarensis TaxID=2498891 RepID=UPI00273CA120|nr:uncharacterized protein LOC131679969 [Topomyia yanbarensis]